MSSWARKGTEDSPPSNAGGLSRYEENMTPTTSSPETTTVAMEGNTQTSNNVAPVKSTDMSSRRVRWNHRKQPLVPSTSSDHVGLDSVFNFGKTQAKPQGIAADETETSVQQDTSSCATESKGAAAADLTSKPDHGGLAPSTSDEMRTAAMSTPTGQRGSNEHAPSEVADIYKALETLTHSQTNQTTRQESIKPFPTFVVGAEASFSNDYPPGIAARRKTNVPFVAKLAMTTMFIVIILASAFLLYPKPKHLLQKFCATEGCETHRYRIEQQLDTGVDPCDNFSAHVCRRWMPRKPLSRSELSDMVLSWLHKLPETLTKGVVHFPTGKKVAAMFNTCITETGSQIHIMREFMRKRGIVWPENPDEPVHPAKVLFDLSFNWNVHLLFTLKVLPAIPTKQPRRIYIAPNELMLLWKTIMDLIPKEYFQKVYADILKLFSNNKSIEPDIEDMLDTGKMLHGVFNTLVSPCPCKARIPGLFSLSDIDTSISDGEHMMNVLNSAMGIDPPFTMDDLVLVSDMLQLANIMNITHQVDDKSILRHLSWLFVVAHAAVADPAAVLLVFHGSKHHAEEERPRFCASQVEPSYKLLISAMASTAHFSEDEQWRIVNHLQDIVQVAAQKTRASSWLDNDTKHAAVAKLTNVRTIVWPSDKFLTAKALEEVYENFTDSAPSFVEYWIETRRSQRLMFGSEAAEQELLLRDNAQLPYVEYVHVLNHLSVALGALAPPLYYQDGTKAMLHGGVLYQYARELLRAIDHEGVKINQHGEFVWNWLSEDQREPFKKRTQDCLPNNASIFPEVPAMEVAYEAFKRNVNENEAQLAPDLTEEKVFFITACLPSCAVTPADNLYGGDCNKAVMNFAPFAEAFGCPVGSNMNPATKCTFYD